MGEVCRRIVAGMEALGWTFDVGGNLYVQADRSQAQMNRHAGELAPTWSLLADGLWRGGRRLVMPGEAPWTRTPQEGVGEGRRRWIGSGYPAGHVAATPWREWALEWEGGDDVRIMVDPPARWMA